MEEIKAFANEVVQNIQRVYHTPSDSLKVSSSPCIEVFSERRGLVERWTLSSTQNPLQNKDFSPETTPTAVLKAVHTFLQALDKKYFVPCSISVKQKGEELTQWSGHTEKKVFAVCVAEQACVLECERLVPGGRLVSTPSVDGDEPSRSRLSSISTEIDARDFANHRRRSLLEFELIPEDIGFRPLCSDWDEEQFSSDEDSEPLDSCSPEEAVLQFKRLCTHSEKLKLFQGQGFVEQKEFVSEWSEFLQG